MENKDIYIVGAGTYGEAMYELAEILGYKINDFYDEDESKLHNLIMGSKVIGKFSDLSAQEVKNKQFIVAIGNNEVRYNIMSKINELEGITPTLIHPAAFVSPSAEIGKGVYIQANAYLWTKVKIDDYCIISPGVVIAHHTSIGKACLISTLTGVGASIKIGEKVFIGMGCMIVTGISYIVESSIIGAGAVVINNIHRSGTYIGVPAKNVKQRSI
ncbi:NeuD/PglB/VioB family sugar acetyltransferase [Planococcus salinarum]|uniref:NeuD/PglB/VioB family sugar acetyltransferase n=1 Tax=Planococcus salinarum TaxID=622695 RepID=UPI000E3E91EF|nr:NeuD/PglB/VioB family sugar acetyltransferase [Planococcus salinarum]TAA72864.1 hypothetical protein D2909_04540 [Planococcus salinarum]